MSEPFVSINELSKRLDVPAHTLRYWEKQFPTAIRPTTGAGGRRYYRGDTADAIARIKNLLHDQGYTIAGVKKLLATGSLTAVNNVGAHNCAQHNLQQEQNSKQKTNTGGRKYAPLQTVENANIEIDNAIDLLKTARAVLAA
ncbi:MAG: MerR family transcriptional regulator [Alphaproteobacteria bacterium]|nr:MerR family transcriptional regulator [Alphaproteobacteria bacterium]